MSRTKRRGRTSSPIKRYLDFSGGTGLITYYDSDKKERVEVEQLNMIILDTPASITGYDEGKKSKVTSNMVADTKTEVLKVVSYKDKKGTDIAEGLYQDIKDQVKNAKGKFTTNVIGMADIGNGMEMVNLQLTGVALGGWIEFASEQDGDYYDNFITFSRGALSKRDGDKNVPVTAKEEKELDAKLAKNPRAPRPVWYYTLNIELGEELSEEESEMAVEKDEELQEYFDKYSSRNTDDDSDSTNSSPQPPADPEGDGKDDLPF